LTLPVTITGISTAVAPVGPFKTSSAASTIYTIATGIATSSVWGTTFSTRYGQTFTTGSSDLTITSVIFALKKNATPTDNLAVDIYLYDTGTSTPTGSSLGTSTVLAGSTLTTSVVRTTFTFTTPVSISPSTRYVAVISRSGAGDATNNYSLGRDAVTGNIDAAQASGVYNSTTSAWSAFGTTDFDLKVNGTTASDAYYFFGRDGTTATTLQAFKSTAPDTSWATIANRTGFTAAILNIAGYQVGNVIHLAVQDGTMASSVATKYLSFDAATDTFLASTETVLAASSIATAGGGNAGQNCSLVVRSNGNVVIFYNGTQAKVSGTFYSNVWYRERTGVNTYGTAVQVSALTANDYTNPIAVLGSSDRTHFLFFSVTTITQRHLTSANTLGTATTTAIASPILDACSYNNAGTTKVVALTSGRAIRFDSADNPSIASSTSVTMGTPVRATDDGTDAYVLYQNSTDSDLYVKKSTDNGATFGSAVSAFVGTVTAADANVSKNQLIYQRGSNVVIPYIVNDNGTLKYNEHTVRSLGPTGYTLTADKGTFTLNGPVNKLAYGRDFNADAGVFALAGADAAMRRGYTLAAAPGAFTLSGKAIACHLKRAAITGNFTLAGQAAILRYSRIFPAAKGTITLAGPVTGTVAARFVRSTVTAYTLSGKDATLNWTSVVLHRTMPAVTGALAVNGQAAALKRTYLVPHTTGAITLNGVAVNLRAIRTMPAVKGTITLGGAATSLRYGHVTATTVGTFTLNGVAAGLRYGHVLTAAPGAVVLAGQPIIFGYGSAKTITASTGTVTLNGPVTKLAYGRAFPTTAGVFTLTGRANTLRYARVMPAVKATLTLNGVVTGLRLNHNMIVTEGTVTLSGKPVTLRYTRLMPAVRGTLLLNGSAANLIWSGAGAKTMPATVGAFVLSGKVVTFKQTAVVKATVTTFTLTGSATTLAAGRRLAAAPGVFTLSGKAAVLTYVRGMSAATGEIRLTGLPVELRRVIRLEYQMPTRSGAFQLSGRYTYLSRSGTEQPGRMSFGHRVTIPNRW